MPKKAMSNRLRTRGGRQFGIGPDGHVYDCHVLNSAKQRRITPSRIQKPKLTATELDQIGRFHQYQRDLAAWQKLRPTEPTRFIKAKSGFQVNIQMDGAITVGCQYVARSTVERAVVLSKAARAKKPSRQ